MPHGLVDRLGQPQHAPASKRSGQDTVVDASNPVAHAPREGKLIVGLLGAPQDGSAALEDDCQARKAPVQSHNVVRIQLYLSAAYSSSELSLTREKVSA
eukprot:CAMPEP_0181199026 /NCGR_PEP_ID=MMETSP1096-20121128/16953_1 /TAXON_ID=156174 ORGANISM="Chrysochromulina ericina, Strain CCMP281" /NCGR_SAMPLE_ID=MMETSP1096 /ASSEMBLY_ACC=CAM_ASM_000453 /LENGTH=98 /DNA_ID=CAMNT_0023289173 /DNA_START=1183 /DNA_END=1476 /DNA_ORIENTATION=-